MKSDVSMLKLQFDDERDRKITEQLIKENYSLIKEIQQSVLEKSSSYPILDPKTVIENFLMPLKLKRNGYEVSKVELESLLGQDKIIYRHKFIEMIIRLAFFMKQPDQLLSASLRSFINTHLKSIQQSHPGRNFERRNYIW